MKRNYIYNSDLKAMIHSKGLKNNWLAAQVGVDRAVFTKWITGERIPSIVQKSILAGVLNCDVSDIFGGDE